MLCQLNPSSSMIINRARLTSAAGETRDRVNDTNARRSSLVRLKTDCMLHIVLLKSMLHSTSSFALHHFVSRLDVRRNPIFAGPTVIFRHAQLLFYLVKRLALALHLSDPVDQEIVVALRIFKDFDGSGSSVARHHEFRIEALHHLKSSQNI